jgi:homoserine dehydrogenase
MEAVDMAYAEHLGFRIKLLAVARRIGNANAAAMEVRVQPALVPAEHLLASVNGSMNAVMVKGDASGITLYYGAGAGSEQTASAVIADLVDVARLADALPAQRVPYLAFQPHAQQPMPLRATPIESSAYYLRVACDSSAQTERALLRTLARAGVQARIHGRYTLADRSVHHVLLTQALQHRVVQQVLEQLAQAKLPAKAIRVERLE